MAENTRNMDMMKNTRDMYWLNAQYARADGDVNMVKNTGNINTDGEYGRNKYIGEDKLYINMANIAKNTREYG